MNKCMALPQLTEVLSVLWQKYISHQNWQQRARRNKQPTTTTTTTIKKTEKKKKKHPKERNQKKDIASGQFH